MRDISIIMTLANKVTKICSKISKIRKILRVAYTQPTFTCSKLTIQILEQGVEYVQCYKLNVSVVINFEHIMAGWVLAM